LQLCDPEGLAGAALTTTEASGHAYAAEPIGTIKSVDMVKDSITLDNGSTYFAPRSVKLSDFKLGEKVRVSYTKSGAALDITSIKPAT
jgi:hypothetical protein